MIWCAVLISPPAGIWLKAEPPSSTRMKPVVVLSAILGRTPSAEEYRDAVEGIDLTKFAPPTSTNPIDTKSVHY